MTKVEKNINIIKHLMRHYVPNHFLKNLNMLQVTSDSPIKVVDELCGNPFFQFLEGKFKKTEVEFARMYKLSQQRLFPFPKDVSIGYLILKREREKIHNDLLDFEFLSLIVDSDINFEDGIIYSGTSVSFKGFSYENEFISSRENNFYGFRKHLRTMSDKNLKSSRITPRKRTLEYVANENFKVGELLPDSWFLRDVK